MKVGKFKFAFTEVFNVLDDEQVIGIKAHTLADATFGSHGKLYNLQFKIAKLI